MYLKRGSNNMMSLLVHAIDVWCPKNRHLDGRAQRPQTHIYNKEQISQRGGGGLHLSAKDTKLRQLVDSLSPCDTWKKRSQPLISEKKKKKIKAMLLSKQWTMQPYYHWKCSSRIKVSSWKGKSHLNSWRWDSSSTLSWSFSHLHHSASFSRPSLFEAEWQVPDGSFELAVPQGHISEKQGK